MVTGVCLSFSIQRKPRPLQYNQGESPCTLTISYQQYGSPHGQTHSARHDPEGALLPPGRDKACAGQPRQGCPSSQWVESSRDPWNVSVKVRRALSVTVPYIFRRYLDGCSLGQIKAELEKDKVPKRCESCTSKSADSAPQDMQNLRPNKKEKSDTEMSDIEKEDLSADGEAELADLLGKCGLAHLPPDAAGMFRNAIERLWRAERFTLEGISLPREKIRADLRRLHSASYRSKSVLSGVVAGTESHSFTPPPTGRPGSRNGGKSFPWWSSATG